ncbi:UpxY family transcription antiterminator [Yeosuana marina]|uniref:UpxY family transcription antiterminator n=1 Tax=Yeosuana marina TaxID=1565536 RepID=UPI0030C7DD26
MNKSFKKGWYVAYTKPKHEMKIHEALSKSHESFLPTKKTLRIWSDRKKWIKTPLFPSYIFIKINSRKEFYRVLSAEGIYNFIRCGENYSLVTEKEINFIKIIVGDEKITDLETLNSSLKVGDVVNINYGSLSGLECQIMNTKNKNKILVKIHSLRQNIIATLPPYYLTPSSLSA